MAASPKRASTPVGDSALNSTTFSLDSLQIGDSTRSLLSPLFDKERECENEQSFHEKTRSENEASGDSSSDARSEYESCSSDYEESETTVKKRQAKKAGEKSSSSTSSSSSSFTSTSKTKQSNSLDTSESCTEQEPCLSSWEKWLLDKIVEDKKRARADKRNREKEKEIKHKEMNEKSSKEKQAKENRKEWLRLKRNEEKVKNELAAKMEAEKLQQKQEEQERIQMKAEESFEKWFQEKEKERKTQSKNRKLTEQERKQNEMQRKQQSEEAYKLWLDKSKKHQKSKNNHFGVLGGKLTGYYDWTTYPMPSYSNPKPWVSPKVRTHYQSKIKLQNPSPPLLFKELEEREGKSKLRKNNAKMKQN